MNRVIARKIPVLAVMLIHEVLRKTNSEELGHATKVIWGRKKWGTCSISDIEKIISYILNILCCKINWIRRRSQTKCGDFHGQGQ